MKFSTFLASALIPLSFAVHAKEAKPFECHTTLEYKINGENRTVELKVLGERSSKNTLNGKGIVAIIDDKIVRINLPSVALSDSVIMVKGTNLKEQTTVALTYFEKSEGSQNMTNSASVAIRTKNGLMIARSAQNEVFCDITK